MMFKSLLLATTVVFAAAPAFAAEYNVANPFYTPGKNNILSSSAYEYTHSKNKDGLKYIENMASEKIAYGITDALQINLTGERSWAKAYFSGEDLAGNCGSCWSYGMTDPDMETVRQNTNSWNAGLAYNIINDGAAFVKVGANYYHSDDLDRRAAGADIIGGYNFKPVTVYASVDFQRETQSSGERKENTLETKIAAFKQFNTAISGDVGFVYEQETGNDKNYTLTAAASYAFTEKAAVTAFGEYLLKSKDKTDEGDIDDAYKIGVRVNIAF